MLKEAESSYNTLAELVCSLVPDTIPSLFSLLHGLKNFIFKKFLHEGLTFLFIVLFNRRQCLSQYDVSLSVHLFLPLLWACWAIWNSSCKKSKRKLYPCTSFWKTASMQWVETQLGLLTEGKADKIHLLVIQFGLRRVIKANPEELKIHWFCCSHNNLDNPVGWYSKGTIWDPVLLPHYWLRSEGNFSGNTVR